MRFQELDLHKNLLAGIEEARFEACMPVQEQTLPETLAGGDVYVQSQTGSGKTAAFLITIFEHFERKAFDRNRALIIVPTRELAVQIEEEAKLLGTHLPYRVGSFFGGVGYDEQLRLLDENVEIVIGTPGRLIDLNERRRLDFRDTSILVIDEADRLFDMGFLPDLRRMLKRMPPRERRLTMLFSATLNSRVWQLAWEYMNDPRQIILNPENLTVDEVHQELYHVARSDKIRLLLGILERERPANALIFTNTKSGAVEVSRRLELNGYQSRYIIGDLPQKKRLHLIDQMKAGKLQILVATDVAARGLHINDLPLVVNYDLPEDPEGYVHRIGRTARAGNSGKAISLACERFVYGLEAIERLIDRKIPVERHDDSLLAEDKVGSRPVGEHARPGSLRPRRPRTGSRSRGGSRSAGSPSGRSRQSVVGSSRRPPAIESRREGDETVAREEATTKAPDAATRRTREKRTTDGERAGGSIRPPKPKRREKSTVSSRDAVEDRLEYYRKKYGEEFRLVEEKTEPENRETDRPRRSVLRRLFGGGRRS